VNLTDASKTTEKRLYTSANQSFMRPFMQLTSIFRRTWQLNTQERGPKRMELKRLEIPHENKISACDAMSGKALLHRKAGVSQPKVRR
jgi:hypothetical protein